MLKRIAAAIRAALARALWEIALTIVVIVYSPIGLPLMIVRRVTTGRWLPPEPPETVADYVPELERGEGKVPQSDGEAVIFYLAAKDRGTVPPLVDRLPAAQQRWLTSLSPEEGQRVLYAGIVKVYRHLDPYSEFVIEGVPLAGPKRSPKKLEVVVNVAGNRSGAAKARPTLPADVAAALDDLANAFEPEPLPVPR